LLGSIALRAWRSAWVAGVFVIAPQAWADPDTMFEPEIAPLSPAPGKYESALRNALLDDAPASCQLLLQP
jgi:hypothetical protein